LRDTVLHTRNPEASHVRRSVYTTKEIEVAASHICRPRVIKYQPLQIQKSKDMDASIGMKIAIGLFFIACLITIVGLILLPSVFVLAKVKNDVAYGNDIGVYEKDSLGNNSQVATGDSTNMTASNTTSSTSTSPNTNANNTTNTSTNATNRSSILSIKSLIEDAMQVSKYTTLVRHLNV
jgi:hypothetical protein